MHIFPAVSRLEEKYANDLVVIGVHSGKYIAERETENVRTATRRLGITHPVVNDRQFRVWRSYSVQAWPTLVLVSPDGRYIGQNAGEITFDMFDPLMETLVEVYTQVGLLDRRPIHFAPDPAPETNSPLRFPGKVLADPMGGRLFISDTGNNRVLVARLGEDGTQAQVIQTIGSSKAGFSDDDFAGAQLHRPEGLTLVVDTLYIADTENHSVRAADLSTETVRTVAGTGEQGNTRAGGPGAITALNSPWDVLEQDGFLYIAMAGTHQLWRLDLESGMVGPFAGSGRENIDDGPNTRATFAQPSGLTTDGERLFFADSESSAIRAADFSPEGYVQTLIGEGLFEFGDRDGKGTQARLQHCLGVAYNDGKLYIADTYNNKIKSYDMASKEVSTALGNGDSSELYEPGGIAVWEGDGAARVFVADTNNHRVLTAVIGEDGKLASQTEVQISL